MKTEDQVQASKIHLSDGMQLILSQDSSLTPRSSRASSRSSSSSGGSTSSDSSYSSSDRSRSPSVSRRPRRRPRHGSRYSSSSSGSSRSRSRSRPRCCRATYHSRCRHRQRSRSYSPYSRRSSRYGRRGYSRSVSRSSSRERYSRRSRRSNSRSPSYRRARGVYNGRFRCRFSPSPPVSRYYRRRSRSPERSVRLSVKDKMELLKIARENAAKILGVEVVKLPASVRYIEEQAKKALESDTEKTMGADSAPAKKTPLDKGESDEDVVGSKTSPSRKPLSFSISNAIAKPSRSPTLHITESKVTSRADSVGNRMPYGQWIPVKRVSTKKR